MYKSNAFTLKKIAKLTGFSTSTVSRALNNNSSISQKTKEKIMLCAKKHEYTPNIYARALRQKYSNTIGVLVPSISHHFTAKIIQGIVQEAENSKYKIVICESSNSHEKEIDMLNMLLNFGVDGILMSLSRKNESIDHILSMYKKVPMVLFDKVSAKVPCTQVVINEIEAAQNAIDHLIQKGKKRIAIIKEPKNSYTSEKRYIGYKNALHKNGLDIQPEYIITTSDISFDKGKIATQQLLKLKKKPDAIFAVTDSAAAGIIAILTQKGYKIPQDIAVIGFSNSKLSTIISPTLTTIDQPGKKIGKTAFNYLTEEIQSKDAILTTKTITLKTKLIIRESTQ